MRASVALGVALAWIAMAQVEKPPEPPAEKPPLQNTGKPMVVDCHCTVEDIQASGLTCTNDDPCPLFLELDAVETVGNRIFLAGNIHTATVTLYSALLASEDGGKTWVEPYERIPAAGLDRIQFIDFQNGWISGEVQRPLPRDPFLLVTSDGGNQWTPQPVFSDSQFGSVSQFAFTSPTNGTLIVDRGAGGESGRYELYETVNGGGTWMLRQANQQTSQIKHPAGSGNADWRLRPDAATKAYRVEHHTAGGWHCVASFAVSIGVCKPPEPAPLPENKPAQSP